MTPPDVFTRRLTEASPDFTAYVAERQRIEHDPNPGSDEAVDAGCICDRERNRDGEGLSWFEMLGHVVFDIDENCPLVRHDEEEDES